MLTKKKKKKEHPGIIVEKLQQSTNNGLSMYLISITNAKNEI